jgi:NAD kinase
MDPRLPRLVLVTRKTLLELLLERHGTTAQARFYLESRRQDIHWYEEAHERFSAAFKRVQAAIPADQRRARVDRTDLDRFLFAPDDVVLVVGQDGLVPNAAKYLHGQLTAGINPDPARYDGVLCRHTAKTVPRLLEWLERRSGQAYRIERRVMAIAEREDGQRLLALNEVFVGHRTHQSARYRLRASGREERQSSSGLICSTGTGSTGWAKSIARQRGLEAELPRPDEPRLAWFVREPFPSVASEANLDYGVLGPGESIELASEMGEDGVIFADGIESDRLEFLDGHRVQLRLADQALNLVVPARS